MIKKVIGTIIFFLFVSSANAVEPTVSSDWLNKNLNSSNVFVLDIRNKLDGGGYDAFKEEHIPGSVHSDYLGAGWRTTIKGVVGQFPGTKALSQLIGGLGVDNQKHVVIVYGGVSSLDFGSAARVYWTFKTIGHENVSILNGGFKEWKNSGNKVVSGENNLSPAKFKTRLNKKYYASFSEVQKAQKGKGSQCLIDARPAAFFTGDKKHAKARIPGRLANARNLQEGNLIDGGFKIKSSSEIKSQFGGLEGVEKYKGYISYCNTGHWAATVWFGLSEIAQIPNVKMYDGGMTHWTYDPKRKVDLS
jgi:thiosulfate/3-mercaptopyruvate sulfurtransferase